MKELILSNACFNGIESTQTRQQIITPEHKQLVKQANEKIKENRHREAEACISARNYLSD